MRRTAAPITKGLPVDFWDIIWFILVSFVFIAYLMVLFSIIGDLFRSPSNGFVKAIWILFLIFLPFLTALIYLIANGRGMAERSAKEAAQIQQAQDSYIKSVAQASPADQIHRAKELLDSGAISQAEFDALKTKALS
jgi:hypothetical protein